MSSATAPDESSIKHRACDECRTRKLACSKDPDGCNRCKRESLSCHYSEQKPMGRPRKRQFIETQPDNALNGPNQNTETLSSILDDVYNEITLPETYLTNYQDLEFSIPQNGGGPQDPKAYPSLALWNFGGGPITSTPPINFGADESESNAYPTPPYASIPQASESPNFSPTNEKTQTQNVPCSCLASMYLALASLQQFPQDIVAALKVVRSAASTAAKAIWCPQCGSIPSNDAVIHVDAFQNMMLLGTMLPVIANGYAKLLKMIDEETDAAVISGQSKVFRFHDYGGMCPEQQTVDEALICVDKEMMFEAVEMPALQWRTTVRALLRVDIYGHVDSNIHHKGLKDLVSEIETRQRTRHFIQEARTAAASSDLINTGHGHLDYGKCPSLNERTHTCLEILKVAKIAIDSLVIP